MDFKQIKELIKLVNDSKVGEVLIENEDLSLRIRHLDFQKKVVSAVAAPAPVSAPVVAAATQPSEPPKPSNEAKGEESKSEEPAEDKNLITIKSPMIGTFYRSSSPDKPPYVKVGDQINKEEVLCIIEAMKLFNEIESEYSGKIVKVLVENEAPVEYDQPLFLIDPIG